MTSLIAYNHIIKTKEFVELHDKINFWKEISSSHFVIACAPADSTLSTFVK